MKNCRQLKAKKLGIFLGTFMTFSVPYDGYVCAESDTGSLGKNVANKSGCSKLNEIARPTDTVTGRLFDYTNDEMIWWIRGYAHFTTECTEAGGHNYQDSDSIMLNSHSSLLIYYKIKSSEL